MLLAGFEFKQPWNSMVYHLTGRGGQFQHGEISQEHEQKSQEWQKLMNNSTMDFIRKWGSQVLHTALMKPIVVPKYNIAFVIDNCDYQNLVYIEPFGDRVYVGNGSEMLIESYISNVQKDTEYDLRKRVFTLENNDPELENDIVVYLDKNRLAKADYDIIAILSRVLNQIESPGEYSLNNLKIKVINVSTYEQEYVSLSSSIYKNKFI
jgi:hypothetical protein